MELVGVSHGLTLQQLGRWEELAQSLGANHWHIYDTGEPAFDAKTTNVTMVPNTHFEFGGYLAGAKGVQTEGPYVILNSTVFQTRSLWTWKRILRSKNAYNAALYGDATPSPNAHIREIPDPYFASWVFVIRDKPALQDFAKALEQTLSKPSPAPSPYYAAYLQHWLEPRNRWYGWHGIKTPQSRARKKQTIQWEHRLSMELRALGIQSFGARSPWHAPAQFFDKILRHWASFAKS